MEPNLFNFIQRFPYFKGSVYDTKYELTGPYMHNGKVPNLEETARVMAKIQLNKELEDAQVQALVAFLKGLTGRLPKQKDRCSRRSGEQINQGLASLGCATARLICCAVWARRNGA